MPPPPARPGCAQLCEDAVQFIQYGESQELSIFFEDEDCWRDAVVLSPPLATSMEHTVTYEVESSIVEPSSKHEEPAVPQALGSSLPEQGTEQLAPSSELLADVVLPIVRPSPEDLSMSAHEQSVRTPPNGKDTSKPAGHGRPIFLSPWNHASRELPYNEFEELRQRHASHMFTKHATTIDLLTGKELGVLDDCILLAVAREPGEAAVWMENDEDWRDAQRLARWLVAACRMKPKLAGMIAKLLSLRAKYEKLVKDEIAREAAAKEAAEAAARKDVPTSRKEVQQTPLEKELAALLAGPPPKAAVAWLQEELQGFLQVCQSMPVPWATPTTQLVQKQLDSLKELPRKFDKEMEEQQKKLSEVKRDLEEQQRTNGQQLMVDQKRGKVELEMKQKEAREEADNELKKLAQEMPGEKREEFMRRGRDKLQQQQRQEMEKWQGQQERDGESAEATLNGMRVAVESTHKRERAVIINEQRREPFNLLEKQLVVEFGELTTKTSLLLTAGAAAGKTCLVAQTVLHVLRNQDSGILPIVVKVHQLQRQLQIEAHADMFENAWNWVDAYLQLVHGASSELYRCLMQAMRSRRTLLILDGIDEGGYKRADIEAHILDVLAVQKHTLLVTSRPVGLQMARFSTHFFCMRICPLSDEQQEQLVKLRAPNDCKPLLGEYIRGKLSCNASGIRITSNPLILSTAICLFQEQNSARDEERQATTTLVSLDADAQVPGLPQTLTAIYEAASKRMLHRVEREDSNKADDLATTMPQLPLLLQESLFQAHIVQQRALEQENILAAALHLCDPKLLAKVKQRTVMPHITPPQRPKDGDWVKVTRGEYAGEYGRLESSIQIRNDSGHIIMQRFSVHFANQTSEAGLAPSAFISSGLDEAQCRAWAQEARPRRLLEACESLPPPVRDGIHGLLHGADDSTLSLLSSFEADPMRTFQEYFVAMALCAGIDLKDMPPWRWTIWWDNTLKLGIEMGDAFRKGLRRGSGASSGQLNLRGKVGGDRQVSLLAVGQLLRVVDIVDLSCNNLGPEGAKVLALAISESVTLRKLNLSENRLGPEGSAIVAGAIESSSSLIQVDMRINELTPADEARLRRICKERRKQRHRLDIHCDLKPTLIEYE